MRIESLSIERYGIHADRRFDFAPGLQVIYGPNEAGKTTLLQLVRDLFFGYDVRHRYRFDEHSGPLKAGATCVTREGRRFHFTRQKGRPDLVTGDFIGTREVLDAGKLERLIGGITATTYQQVFAFSLEELRQGGDLLAEAGLQRALFGVGMGGLPQLQALQQRVKKGQADLLNVHGAAKKQVINDLLIQIQKAKEAHKQSTLRPHDYSRQLDALRDHEEQIQSIRASLEELRQEQSRLQRHLRALPIQRECARLREALADLPQTGTFPADAVERYSRLVSRRDELEIELAQLSEHESAASHEGTIAIEDECLLKLAGEIRTLQGRHTALIYQAEQQKDLLNRIAEGRRELDSQMQSLPPGWTLDRLSSFDRATPDITVLENLSRELQALRQELSDIESESGTLMARVETCERALEDVPDDPRLPALESLLEGREQEWKARSQLVQVQRNISRLCDQLEDRRQILATGINWTSRTPVDMEALLDVATPLSSAVAEFERDFANLEAERDEALGALKRQQAELKLAVRKLEELQRERDIPDPLQLPPLRTKRNELWAIFRQRLSQSQKIPTADSASTDELVDDLQRSIDACDAFADELLRSAADVAHQSRLTADVARLQLSADEALADVNRIGRSFDDLQQRWRLLWEPAGVLPHLPAAMQDWMSRLDEFRDLHSDLLAGEREELELSSDVAGVQRELNRAFPDAVDFDDAWRRAEQLRDRLRAASSERARLLKEHHESNGLLTAFEKQQIEVTFKLAELQQRGVAVAQRFNVPIDWEVDMLLRTLKSLCDAARRQEDLTRLESFLTAQGQEWERFREQLAEVRQRLPFIPPSLSESQALIEIESRLQSAENRLEEHRQFVERQTHAERNRLTCLAKRQDVEDQIEALAASCVLEQSELPMFIGRVSQARDTTAKLAARSDQLAAVLQSGESEETLAELDVDAITSRLQGIEHDVHLAQNDLSRLEQQVGVMRRDLQQWEVDEQPIRLAAEIASLQARLTHAVDQWAPLALSDALMTAARDRFQKLHQPRLIAEVERIFRRMTAGEYEQIDCSLDQNEKQPLTVRHRDGQQRTTQQLSSGTSEQLYLAIRLAYVSDYARLSEPMPMVMDDVLVNFDEQRALETLEVLVELAEASQILFLTCHRRTVELLRQLSPDAHVVELNGSLTGADADVPLHAEVQLDHEARKAARHQKRRLDRPGQSVLFPPS